MKSKILINKFTILGGIIIFGLLFFYCFLLISGYGYKKDQNQSTDAIITVLPAAVIPTNDLSFLLQTPTPTLDASLGNLNGIQVGVYVQISGTGGDGLRIRNNAGKNAETNFVANESEVFKIIGGPVKADDIIWWQLSAPYDENRQGWAASDYLSKIEGQ